MPHCRSGRRLENALGQSLIKAAVVYFGSSSRIYFSLSVLGEGSMRFVHLWKKLVLAAAVIAALYAGNSLLSASAENHFTAAMGPAGEACPNDDSGLKLPAGFCATIFADGIGHARHMVVAPNGVVYVNTWSGEYYGNDK